MDDKGIRERLDAADWGDLYARLLEFALARCARNPSLAPDLAQGAITRVFAHDHRWDPSREPDLLRYLMTVVNSLLANERTSAASRRTLSLSPPGPTSDAALDLPDPHPDPESALASARLFARHLELLGQRLADDPRGLQMLTLTKSGVDTPAAIRAATGWSADVLTTVRRRFLRAAAQVARDVGGEDDDPSSAPEDAGDDEDEVA